MRVVDGVAQRFIRAARGEMRSAMTYSVVAVVLTLVAFGMAVQQGDTWWWVLVGFMAAEVLRETSTAWVTWREYREIRRCASCREAAYRVGEAFRDWSECAGAHHATVELVNGDQR